jgi:hypothetical protein
MYLGSHLPCVFALPMERCKAGTNELESLLLDFVKTKLYLLGDA